MITPPLPLPPPSRPAPRVAVLDGLRGLAVLLVLVYHLHEYVPILWPGTSAFGPNNPLQRPMGFFWIGVDLFYVLSGFFIGSAVLRPAEWQPLPFIRSRLTRILPAYYVSMVVALLLLERGLLGNLQGWVNIAMHALMMHNLQTWSMFSINGPYWTLGVEFAFYGLMLALAPVLRLPRGWLLLPLMLVVCYVWRAALMVGIPHAERFFWGVQLPGALDEFVLGIVVAYAHQLGLLQRLTNRPLVGVSLAAAGLLLVVLCLTHYVRLKTDYWQSFGTVMWSRTVLATGFALLITAFLTLANHPVLQGLVRFSGLGWLGMLSFSVYLYHVPVILLLHRHLTPVLQPGWLWNISAMAASCGLAYASYRLVERRWHAGL